jgi:hypothetical protein
MYSSLLAALLAAAMFLPPASSHAGVDAASLCKDKKTKATGAATLGLLNAFGRNQKTQNLAKLAQDISKAQSKMTKSFTKAEFSASGAPRGCSTEGDVGVIEDKVEMFVADIVGEFTATTTTEPPPTTTSSAPTTTPTTSTTSTTTVPPGFCCQNHNPACFAAPGGCLYGSGGGIPGKVCDATFGCVSPPGTPAAFCCEMDGGCDISALLPGFCTMFGGTLVANAVCWPDGTCRVP